MLKPVTQFLSALGISLSLGLFVVGGTGCVSQDQSDAQLDLLREKDSQILELQIRIEELQDQLAALQGAHTRTAELIAERDRLLALLDEANGTINQLKKMPPVTIRIKPEVSSALAGLASQYPDLMTYDAKRGMIRLKSDLTFGSGSIEVSEGAVTALSRVAGALNSSAAKSYDIRIVGHTDSVKVRQLPGRRFNDNWELSTFRALAVKDVLTDSGIADTRVEAAGRGQFQPVTENTAKGAQANRRVEIFLVEATTPGTPGSATPTTSSSSATSGASTDPTPASTLTK